MREIGKSSTCEYGLATGPIIGLSANPRTMLKFKNELALEHPNYVCEQVKKAIEVIITKK